MDTPISKNVVGELDRQAYATRPKGSMGTCMSIYLNSDIAKLSSALYSRLMVIKAQIDMLLNVIINIKMYHLPMLPFGLVAYA